MVGEIRSEHGGIPPWRARGLLVEQGAPAQMVAGVTVMAIGVILLLGRFGIVHAVGVWHLWPVLLIGLGAVKLGLPVTDGGRHGAVLVVSGVWLLLSELRIWRAEDSWPLLLVAFGLRIVWKALRGRAAGSGAGQ